MTRRLERSEIPAEAVALMIYAETGTVRLTVIVITKKPHYNINDMFQVVIYRRGCH